MKSDEKASFELKSDEGGLDCFATKKWHINTGLAAKPKRGVPGVEDIAWPQARRERLHYVRHNTDVAAESNRNWQLNLA